MRCRGVAGVGDRDMDPDVRDGRHDQGQEVGAGGGKTWRHDGAAIAARTTPGTARLLMVAGGGRPMVRHARIRHRGHIHRRGGARDGERRQARNRKHQPEHRCPGQHPSCPGQRPTSSPGRSREWHQRSVLCHAATLPRVRRNRKTLISTGRGRGNARFINVRAGVNYLGERGSVAAGGAAPGPGIRQALQPPSVDVATTRSRAPTPEPGPTRRAPPGQNPCGGRPSPSAAARRSGTAR